MRALVVALIALLWCAQPASAEPISAMIALLGTPGMGALTIGGVAVKGLVTSLLLNVASSALQAAIARRQPQPGIRNTQTLNGALHPEAFILGRYATSGAMLCPPMSHGASGRTPNAYLNYVIEVGGIPGHDLAGLSINGEVAEILADDPHPDYGSRLGGRFEGRAWVRWHDGTQTAADAMLLAKYPVPHVRPWSADMVGLGIAYAVVTFLFDREVYQSWPQVRFVIDGIPLYDPSRDSSVGGTGPQRWNDRSTWARSLNPAVQRYNILRGIELPSGEVWGGGIPAEDLPLEVWIPAIDAGDELVSDGDGGNEPAYRAGFEVQVDDEPFAVIEELDKAGGSRTFEVGGVWLTQVGPPPMPVMFLSDEDFLADEQADFKPFPSPDRIFNGVEASHPDPEANWEGGEAPPLYNAAWEAEDGGRRLVASLSLPACPYPVQVQRIMAADIADHRRMRVLILPLPSDAAILDPGDVIGLTHPSWGFAAKLVQVVGAERDLATGHVRASLREVDPDDYDPPAGLIRPLPPDRRPLLPAVQAVPGFAVHPHEFQDADGTPRRPGVRVVWDPDGAEDARGVRIARRLVDEAGDGEELPIHDIRRGQAVEERLPATAYQYRARLVADRPTIWTDWVSVTTPDVRIGAVELAPTLVETIEQAQTNAQAAANQAAQALSTAQSIQNTVNIDTAAAIAAANQARNEALAAVASASAILGETEEARDQTEAYQLAAEAARNGAQGALAAAQTVRDQAQSARDAAQAAQTASETARNQAQTQATTAGGHASAAAGSASTAAGHATAAGNSASAAAASVVAAEAVAMALGPSTFEEGFRWWTRAIGGEPASRSPLLPSMWTHDGDVIRIAAPIAANTFVIPRGYVRVHQGRRYRVEALARHVGAFAGGSEAGSISMHGYAADLDYVSASPGGAGSSSHNFDAPDSWQTLTWEFVWASDQPYLDLILRINAAAFGVGGPQIELRRIAILDVTESHGAAEAASASANSASAAAASATAAGNSATASNAERLAAQTARSAAEAARDTAVTASNTAEGAASTATSQAGIAATARAAAERVAAEALPSSFEDGWQYWSSTWGGTPGSKPRNFTAWGLDTVDGAQVAAITAPVSGNFNVSPQGHLRAVEGRRYRISVRARHVGAFAGGSQTGGLRAYFYKISSTFGSISALASTLLSFDAPDTWQTLTLTATHDGSSPWLNGFVQVRESNFGVAGPRIEVSHITVEDVTESEAAEQAASASAASASAATAQATAAGQSASAANTDRLAAQTARSGSEAARDTAVTASNTATGAASTATTQAGLAATARTGAEDAASASSGSASAAAASATAAGNSAAAANSDRLAAQTARSGSEAARDTAVTASNTAQGAASTATTQAGIVTAVARDLLPAGYGDGLTHWAQRAASSPTDIAAPSSRWAAGLDGGQPVARMANLGANASSSNAHHLMQRGVIPVVEGDVVRIETRLRTGDGAGAPSGNGIGLRWSWLDADYAEISGPSTSRSGANTAYEVYTGDAAAPSGAVYCRVGICTWSSGGVWDGSTRDLIVSLLRGVNVTSETAAAGSASASANSASAAASSATAAGASASAANTDRLAAQTARSGSEAARDAAITASNTATGAASTATTQAGISTSAATAAGNSATASANSASAAASSATAAGNSAAAANTDRLAAQAARAGSEAARDTAVTASNTAQGAATTATERLNLLSRIAPTSLLPNGIFASGDLFGWVGDVDTAQVVVVERGGSAAAQINAPTQYMARISYHDDAREIAVDDIPVVAGETYAIHARRAAGGSGDGIEVQFRLDFYTAAGDPLTAGIVPATVSTTGWQLTTGDLTVPAGAVRARFAARRVAGSGSGRALFLTDLRLDRESAATIARVAQTYITSANATSAIAGAINTYNASVPGGLAATVTTQTTAIANLNGYAAAMNAVTAEVVGGKIAGLRMMAWNGGSGVTSGSLLELIGDQVVARGSLSASALTIGDFQGLIPNPAFDSDFAGWEKYGGTGYSVVTYRGEHGVGLQINKGSATAEAGVRIVGWGSNETHIQVRPGDQYAARLKVRRLAGTSGGNIGLIRRYHHADGSMTTDSSGTVTSSTPVNTTRDLETSFTIPAGVSHISFRLYYGSNANSANGQVLITDIDVRKVSGSIHIANGAIGGAHLITTEALITNSAQIGSAVIGSAHIAGDLRSTNYAAGTAGWIINRNGSAQFHDLVVRGWLQVGSVSDIEMVWHPGSGVYDTGNWVDVATITLGAMDPTDLWHLHAMAQVCTPYSGARTRLLVRSRYHDGTAWGAWETETTTIYSANQVGIWLPLNWSRTVAADAANCQLNLRAATEGVGGGDIPNVRRWAVSGRKVMR